MIPSEVPSRAVMKESDMMNINKDTIAMRTRFVWGGLLCMMALSCTMTQLEQDEVTAPVELTFQASLGDNQDTKTVLQEDRMSIWWSPKDSIKVYCGDYSSGLFISTNSEPVDRTVFTGALNAVTGTIDNENSTSDFWAVYPYRLAREGYGSDVVVYLPNEQIAADNTFARGMFPAVARSQNMSLSFYNICGGIVFTVQEEGIKNVILRGNNDEVLAGRSYVYFLSQNYPKATVYEGEGATTITLKAPGGGTFTPGVRYFISVYPQAFDNGITLTFFKAASKSEVTWTKPAEIKRSRFLIIENADAEAGEYEYAIPEEAYKDMDALNYCFLENIASRGGAYIYSPLRILFNLCGDDVYAAGSNYGDNDFLSQLNEFRYDSAHETIDLLYPRFYTVINKASSFIQKYQEDLPKILGPARVLRAYSQMMLALGWGAPPLGDHVFADSELPANNVLTQKQILEWCAQECEAAIPILEERESPQDKEGAYKITKGFAQALAGKAYLFAGNYQKAKDLLGTVINSGKYALVPGDRFWENFHVEGDGNEEKIFEPNIEYTPGSSAFGVGGSMVITTWMESNLLCWRTDHFVRSPHYGYTGVDGWGFLGVPEAFAESFVNNDGKDSYRLNASIIHIDDVIGGSMYGDSELDNMSKEEKLASEAVGIRDFYGLYGQSFWLPFKQMIKKTDTNPSCGYNYRWNNYTIMRYAEVLLLYAEACLMTGDSAGALDAINQIQRRAGSQTVSTTVDMDVLKREKQFELWFEGSRWIDLVRWGDTDGVQQAGQSVTVLYDKFFRAPQSNDENVIWENGAEENSRFYIASTHEAKNQGYQIGFVAGKHNLFPYPQTQMAANPNLVQNPGW